jgi:hypothetical protein
VATFIEKAVIPLSYLVPIASHFGQGGNGGLREFTVGNHVAFEIGHAGAELGFLKCEAVYGETFGSWPMRYDLVVAHWVSAPLTDKQPRLIPAAVAVSRRPPTVSC